MHFVRTVRTQRQNKIRTVSDFPEKLRDLRHRLDLTQSQMAEKMGLSMSYVYQLEAGKRVPSDAVVALVTMLGEQLEAGLIELPSSSAAPAVAQEPVSSRRIPVLGWAHAGQAAAYEELPHDYQVTIPTDCRDPKAFGVHLEGDSMRPQFDDGDLLVLMPSQEVYSGCFAVARFVDDGVVFRRIEFTGNQIQLVPLNERYQVTTHSREDFSWVYPVWGSWTQLWKG